MTSAVWAGTVFGPRLWPLSARRHLLADFEAEMERVLTFISINFLVWTLQYTETLVFYLFCT